MILFKFLDQLSLENEYFQVRFIMKIDLMLLRSS